MQGFPPFVYVLCHFTFTVPLRFLLPQQGFELWLYGTILHPESWAKPVTGSSDVAAWQEGSSLQPLWCFQWWSTSVGRPFPVFLHNSFLRSGKPFMIPALFCFNTWFSNLERIKSLIAPPCLTYNFSSLMLKGSSAQKCRDGTSFTGLLRYELWFFLNKLHNAF